MHLGPKNQHHDYYMGEGEDRQPLAEIKEEKYLEFWTTKNMKSDRQCLTSANKPTSAF